MKTIVYIIPALIKSGPVNVLYNIVKYLTKEKYRPIVVALYEHQLRHRDNTNSFRELGIETHVYNYTKWQLQSKTAQIAEELYHKYSPNGEVVFHAHGYYPTLILAKMKNAKTMTTIHNRCSEDFKSRFGLLLGTYMSWSYKYALRKINICVPICETMKSYYGKDKNLNLQVVYNGVNVETHSLDNCQAKIDLSIPVETIVLLYPAAFSKGKNHQMIIHELKSVESNNFLVLFAGMGDEEEKCKLLVGDDKRFRFLGYQMDMAKYWAASDFMISSSLSEGLPMAVLEALTKGIPCILSDIPPHMEILNSVFGNTKLCFSANKRGMLKNVFSNYGHNIYNKKEIQEKAIKLYSSEVMTKNYEKIYSSL